MSDQLQFLDYFKFATYTDNVFIFGPLPRKEFSNLYDKLNQLSIGYYAQYDNPTSVNDDKAKINVFVQFQQANKLVAALRKLDNALASSLVGTSE